MNNHELVINILSRNDLDYRDLVYKIAIRNPEAILSHFIPDWVGVAKSMYTPQNKIETIKYVRSMSSMGLKDAKEWVEANCL